jgi:hypothetical protein
MSIRTIEPKFRAGQIVMMKMGIKEKPFRILSVQWYAEGETWAYQWNRKNFASEHMIRKITAEEIEGPDGEKVRAAEGKALEDSGTRIIASMCLLRFVRICWSTTFATFPLVLRGFQALRENPKQPSAALAIGSLVNSEA